MAENNNNKEVQVQEILEGIHVTYLENGKVQLTHGTHQCVRKVHEFPEYLRTQE